jgi:acetylornithine deacetylase/succinyl-diaminopimelate desuccinylase-like protein
VLNEGGGLALPLGNRNLYTVQTAEKGILWFRVKAKGQPGHGSVPGTADNAILRINSVIEKIRNYHPGIKIVPVVREYIEEIAKQDRTARPCLTSLLEDPDRGDSALDEFAKQDKSLAEEFRAKVKMTITPTMIQGGVKENIIPSDCEAVFDCRVLPGQNPMKTLEMIEGLLKDVGLEKLQFEVIQANEPSESSSDTNLFRLIAKVLREFEPNCSVAPDMLTGGTDSRFFRKKGSICYGFQPMRADMPYGEILKGIHGVDERISIENLVFGTTVLYETVKRFVT